MYLDLVVLRCFLFEPGRSPIPSRCQHNERSIAQASCVSGSVVDIGVSAAFARNDSALVSRCASLLGIRHKRLWLCFELCQYGVLLGGQIGRRRAAFSTREETDYAKPCRCWDSDTNQMSRAAGHTI